MKTAYITLGCKCNQYETQLMEQRMQAAGFASAAPEEEPDIVVVNTCTVTAQSDAKARQLLHSLRRRYPQALLAFTGCLPQADPAQAERLAEADVVTGTAQRSRIASLVAQALTTGTRVVDVAPHKPGEAYEPGAAQGHTGHTRAFVKIEDGCAAYCSYCIIPFACGPVRSKPAADVAAEVFSLAQAGFLEIVLVGINLSAWGIDLGGSLADALEAADGAVSQASSSGVPSARLRLGSLEPLLIDDVFVSRLANLRHLCPHFHLSMQSGCAETLRRMNRRYTPEQYAQAVARLRDAFPGCAVTTDIIAGFPGETAEEFERTLAFVNEIGFAQAHVFPYSKRPGTKAASMPGQLTRAEKARRAWLLTQACAHSRACFLAAQAGRTADVLFESQTVTGQWEGFTPEYVPVRTVFPEGFDAAGKLLRVRVTQAYPDYCRGEAAHSDA